LQAQATAPALTSRTPLLISMPSRRRFSADSRQLSAFSFQPSAFSRQLSAVSRQLSAFSFQVLETYSMLYRSQPSSPAIAALPVCGSVHQGAPASSAPVADAPARASAAARVQHAGASQLNSPNIVLLFDAQYPNAELFYPWHLYHCLAGLVGGAFAAGLQQYGAGPGRYAGFSEPAFPAGPVSTDQLATWLDAELAAGSQPEQALYMLFPGLGTNLGEPGFQYGVDFCAYHSVTAFGRPYAVMPYPIDQPGHRSPPGTCGQALGLSDLDCLTMTASHELAEAMTDAVPGEGEDGPEGEIDDFAPCLWNPVTISFDGWSYRIQAYWDKAAGACWTPVGEPSAVSH
jgi:hypothetical protein